MWRQILLIEDQKVAFSRSLDDGWLTGQRIRCATLPWPSSADDGLADRRADLILLAPPLRTGDLNQFFASIDARPSRPPVIAVLPSDAAPDLFHAVAGRADDFLVWRPDCIEELRHRILRMLASTERTVAARHLTESAALAKLVGRAPNFVATLERIPLIARTGNTVLVVGETGTGKELCARAIHHLSARRAMPFIPVDCCVLPDQLVENELFGHLRGAFTDAHRDQGGLLQMAQGGTLFLDEIDSLALSAQAKLLRLIEERTFRPLGADRFVRADVRIVAATSTGLEELVRQKRFRPDLYFRLNVFQLRLPPLRERPGDVALLARHFVDHLCAEARVPPKVFAPSALQKLARASWPGNVRELFNAMQNAVVLSEGRVILANHLPGPDPIARAIEPAGGFNDAKAQALEQFERSYLEALLRKHAGNITQCAIEARKDRRSFGRLVKKHNIDRLAV